MSTGGGPPTFHWTHSVPWVLSLIALGFSFYNFRRGNRIASEIRRANIARDEFNTNIRTPIETSLTEVFNQVYKLKGLTRSFKGLPDIKQELDEHARAITDKMDGLFEALESADRVQWVSGDDWAAVAQTHWDRFLAAAELAGEAQAQPAAVDAIGTSVLALEDLRDFLRRRIEQEIERHLSSQ